MNTFADRVIHYLQTLEPPTLPNLHWEVMHPHGSEPARTWSERFYRRYYSDNHPRIAVFGINPGRWGSGITGIPFTDPTQLEAVLPEFGRIEGRTEMSAQYIHRVIRAYGSYESFYQQIYFTSVYPFGLLYQGVNANYYDYPEVYELLEPQIRSSIDRQVSMGIRRDKAFCLGEGQNIKLLKTLNKKHGWFDRIYSLPHPRYVMQYKRKRIAEFEDLYLTTLLGDLL